MLFDLFWSLEEEQVFTDAIENVVLSPDIAEAGANVIWEICINATTT